MNNDTYQLVWLLGEVCVGVGAMIFYIAMDNQQEEKFKAKMAEADLNPRLPSSPHDHLVFTAAKLRLLAYELRTLGLHKQANEVDSEIERIKQKYLNEVKKAAS